MGAIGVVELAERPALDALKAALVDQGVWIRPFGRIVYVTPALTITEGELERLMGAIRNVLDARFGHCPT